MTYWVKHLPVDIALIPLVVIITFALAHYIPRLIVSLLGRSRLHPNIIILVSLSVLLGIISGGIYAILTLLGLRSVPFVPAGSIGLAIGFGLQTLLQNLIAGIVILAGRKFRPGDRITVNGGKPTIVSGTHLRTTTGTGPDGQIMDIPNATILTGTVEIEHAPFPPSPSDAKTGASGSPTPSKGVVNHVF